jgi:hypothetical protein
MKMDISIERAERAFSGGQYQVSLAALPAQVAHGGTVRFLLEATQEHLRRLTAELDHYQAETESRRRQYDSTADVPARALTSWAGLRGMVRDRDGAPVGSCVQSGGETP